MAVPVLEDALERSVDLAAAMDARGFGRRGSGPRRERLLASTLTIAGLLAICAGTYGLLASGAPALLGVPMTLAGALVGGAGFPGGKRTRGGRQYRPHRWHHPE